MSDQNRTSEYIVHQVRHRAVSNRKIPLRDVIFDSLIAGGINPEGDVDLESVKQLVVAGTAAREVSDIPVCA